jgi:hypothetical protein
MVFVVPEPGYEAFRRDPASLLPSARCSKNRFILPEG